MYLTCVSCDFLANSVLCFSQSTLHSRIRVLFPEVLHVWWLGRTTPDIHISHKPLQLPIDRPQAD